MHRGANLSMPPEPCWLRGEGAEKLSGISEEIIEKFSQESLTYEDAYKVLTYVNETLLYRSRFIHL